MSDGPRGYTPEEKERGDDQAWHIPAWGCVAVVVALAALIYLFRGPIGLTLAIASAERRPELLRDAEWGKQRSARLFERQFHSGASESQLLSWLSDNRFTIDRETARASRRVQSLPCNESIDIRWASDDGGRLISATAMVQEAGCL